MFEIVAMGEPTVCVDGQGNRETRVQVVFEGGRKLTPPNSYMASHWLPEAVAATLKVGDEYDLAQHARTSEPPKVLKRDRLSDIEAELELCPIEENAYAAVDKLRVYCHELLRTVQQLRVQWRQAERNDRKRIAQEKLATFLAVQRVPPDLLDSIIERQQPGAFAARNMIRRGWTPPQHQAAE